MPTLLPRFQVTETPEVARALEIAEEAWPGLARSERVKRLLVQGAEALSRAREQGDERVRDAIRSAAGSMSGVYGEGYLAGLRDEWPA